MFENRSHGCRCKLLSSFGAANTSSVSELFVTFLVRYNALTHLWAFGDAIDVRVSPFYGTLERRPFYDSYIMLVEDPFDSYENTARALSTWNGVLDPGSTCASFQVAASFLQISSAAESLHSLGCVKRLVCLLFGESAEAYVQFDEAGFTRAIQKQLMEKNAKPAAGNESPSTADLKAKLPKRSLAKVRHFVSFSRLRKTLIGYFDS